MFTGDMSMDPLLYEIEEQEEIGIVRFLDRIELFQAAQIRAEILEWIHTHQPKGVVFSFAEVPYIDSSGVGIFVNLQHQLAQSVPMRLCQMSTTVRDVLTFTNLVSVFSIDETEAESIAAIRAPRAEA
jgi:stage II sporulation protein AA (anti-sigma F factor antagonist)